MIVQARIHSSPLEAVSNLPKAPGHERATILHLNIIGNFAAQRFAPFVESVDWNQTPAFLEKPAGATARCQRFQCALFVFCPVRNQTPSKCIQNLLASLRVTPDRQNALGRRDVVTDREVELVVGSGYDTGEQVVLRMLFADTAGPDRNRGSLYCLMWEGKEGN
jgi:hypothetical protein